MIATRMNSFFVAVQFLTTLPVPFDVRFDGQAQSWSLVYYPIVGVLIGCLLWVISLLPGHDLLTAALLVMSWVVVTGALHLDGLADTADAWVGGLGDRARTLEIMKDPASGPMGVTAIGLALLLKFAAVVALLEQTSTWVLLIPPVLGRTAVVVMVLTTRYVRKGGIAAAIEAYLPRKVLVMETCIVVLSMLWLMGQAGFVVILALAFQLAWLRRAFVKRLAGITGDTLGALVEIMEVTTLVLLVWLYT